MPSPNYTLAFVEFSKGVPLEEIAVALAIPLQTLRRRAMDEGWRSMVAQLPVPLDSRELGSAIDLDAIRLNRERNLKIAQGLQEDLLDQVEKLRKGTLKVPRTLRTGAEVGATPNIQDRLALAQYAHKVAEASYRALGDVVSASQAAQNDPNQKNGDTFLICLPRAVAEPRDKREPAAGDYIDVTPAEQSEPPAP